MAEKLEQEYAEKCRILIEIMGFLKTERLVLRNLMPQDADVMFDYRNNEICSRYQKGQTKDYAKFAKMIERRRADVLSAEAPFMVAVALKETDEMTGEIVVKPKTDMIELGYTCSYRYHRRGYAFEALTALIDQLHRMAPDRAFISFVEPQNTASMGLLRKLGYRDMGYVPEIESQMFGKWTKADEEKKRDGEEKEGARITGEKDKTLLQSSVLTNDGTGYNIIVR